MTTITMKDFKNELAGINTISELYDIIELNGHILTAKQVQLVQAKIDSL